MGFHPALEAPAAVMQKHVATIAQGDGVHSSSGTRRFLAAVRALAPRAASAARVAVPIVAMDEYTFVAAVASTSRLLLFLLGAASDAFLPDYDTSTSLHAPHCVDHSPSVSKSTFERAVESSIVWDSVYFERVARCGYEFEHFFAFFPGWPAALAFGSLGLGHPWTQVTGILLSWLCFSVSAVLLYRCDLVHDDGSGLLVPELLQCHLHVDSIDTQTCFMSAVFQHSMLDP